MTRLLDLGLTLGVGTVILTLTGCDDEPTCAVATIVTGGYDGSIDWLLSGTDSCAIGDPVTLNPAGTALVFIDSSAAVPQQLFVMPDTPVPAVGLYTGRVMLVAGANLWDSGAGNCTVEVTRYEVEDWTQIDFVRVRGQVVCAAPLFSAVPGVADSALSQVILFDVHLYNDRQPLQF